MHNSELYTPIAQNFFVFLRDAGWKPGQKGQEGAQWLDQIAGQQWWVPVDDMSLKQLIDLVAHKVKEIDDEAASKVEAVKEELEEIKKHEDEDWNDLVDKNQKLQATIEALEAKVKELEEGRNTITTPTGEPSNKEQVEGRAQRTVTPPKSGATKTVWDVADYLTTTKIPTRTELVEHVKASHPDIKEATTAAAYSNWAKYNGIDPKTAKKVEGVSAYAFVVGPSKPVETTEEVVWQTPVAELNPKTVKPFASDGSDIYCDDCKNYHTGPCSKVAFSPPEGITQMSSGPWVVVPAPSTFIPPPPLPIIPPPPLPTSNNPY